MSQSSRSQNLDHTPDGNECAPSQGSTDPIVTAAFRVLAECRAFVSGIDGDTYSTPSTLLVGGTIGKHLRHTLDHFAAVAPALDGQTICYDRRTRDVPMETEPGAGLAEIHRLHELLGRINRAGLAAPARVRIMCSADGRESEVTSTLGRELAFATHHAIHHQAMMKAIAIEHGVSFEAATHSRSGSGAGYGFNAIPGPAIPPSFGVAPSTTKHAAGSVARNDCSQRAVNRPADRPSCS